jgi:uncharacterized protein YndB with AHSA1/START domain
MVVTQTVAAPPDLVWRVFTDVARRPSWLPDVDAVTVLAQDADSTHWRESRFVRSARERTAVVGELRLTVLEPGRRCVVSLASQERTAGREYAFGRIDIGPQRGGTVITVSDASPALAGRLLDLVAGGFATRTVEGAVREELEALASACVTRVMVAA